MVESFWHCIAEPSVDEADLGDEAKLLDSDYEEAAPRKR